MNMGRVRISALAVLMALVVALVAIQIVGAARDEHAAASGCPALVAGSNDATTDYIDLFLWNDTYYFKVDTPSVNERPPLGKQLTTVGCSIADLTAENHQQVENFPWPDRTATFLRTDSPVYEIRELSERCWVAVQDGPDLEIYQATDMDTGKPLPACGPRPG